MFLALAQKAEALRKAVVQELQAYQTSWFSSPKRTIGDGFCGASDRFRNMLKKSCAPRSFRPAAPIDTSSAVIGVVATAIENWSMAKSQARWNVVESTKSRCLLILSDDSRNRALLVGFVTGFGIWIISWLVWFWI
jgi:hypothetical protein